MRIEPKTFTAALATGNHLLVQLKENQANLSDAVRAITARRGQPPAPPQVRQVQGAAAPVGSAPATLRAEVHVECTVPKYLCLQMEQRLLNELKGILSNHTTPMASERIALLQEQSRESDAKVRELTGRNGDMATLPKQIDELTGERIATEARVTALEEQITRMQNEAAEKIKTDPVVQELAEIVKLQEHALEQTEKAQVQGLGAQDAITACRIKLSEARMALALRKEALATAGSQLATFSSHLADLSVERAVLATKIKAAKDKKLELHAELLDLRAQIAQLPKDIEQTKGYSIGKVERRIEPLPPESQPEAGPAAR